MSDSQYSELTVLDPTQLAKACGAQGVDALTGWSGPNPQLPSYRDLGASSAHNSSAAVRLPEGLGATAIFFAQPLPFGPVMHS